MSRKPIFFNTPSSLRWIVRMAWRDGRHERTRLALMASAVLVGVAAMVALDLLNTGLRKDIDQNARELLGADVVVYASRKPVDVFQKVLDSLPHPKALEVSMASMVMFLRDSSSRLIRLAAYSKDFPFYGKWETLPENAIHDLHRGGFALLDEALATQYEVSSGDLLKLGTKVFRVAGVVQRLPGGGGILTTLTPSIYISLDDLDATGLVQFGSRLDYRIYLKAESASESGKLVSFLTPLARKYGYGLDDVEERKRELGRAFESVYRFFYLLAFIALVLGGIGITSSVHVYASERAEDVAVLRCLGTPGWSAFLIYFIQILAVGILGSLAGVVSGILIYLSVPYFLRDVLPLELAWRISWLSPGKGILTGMVLSALFSAWPLMAVRFVPPLRVLRPDYDPARRVSKAQMVIIVAAVMFPFLLVWAQTRSLLTALGFSVGLGLGIALLSGWAVVLLSMVRRFFPQHAPFVWRHALASLFRPRNQTQMLTVTIGLGAFLLCTLNIVEESLLQQVEFTGNTNQSNTILFDIQPHQKKDLVRLFQENQLPLHQMVPIVTCRLAELKGRKIHDYQQDTTVRIPNWALMREYRITYRDTLHHSEKLIKGKLQYFTAGHRDSVWVTVSEGMHETLQIDIGDSLLFDIQGVLVKVRISGIRKVEWQRDPPNFIFVFPEGVLEKAPQIYVAATRISDPDKANRFQQVLLQRMPNVSVIDLRLVLSTIDNLFSRLGSMVRVLALFSVVASLVVLAGAVTATQHVRQRENALLRTLGAGSALITGVTLIEYGYLGIFATLTGTGLAVGGGYALATLFFNIKFGVALTELVTLACSVVLLTVIVGWVNLRKVLYSPPLEVLRSD
jgi:putative ABC transport system permease protein